MALPASGAFADEGRGSAGALSVIQSDEQGVILELIVPGQDLEERVVDGQVYQSISIPGWGQTLEVGRPQLPVLQVPLGVPPGADLRVQVLEAQPDLLPGRYELLPVPYYVLDLDPQAQDLEDEGVGPRPEFVRDQVVYAADAFYPELVAEISKEGMMRDQRVASLSLRPFQYNPATGEVRVYHRLVVQVTFGRSPAVLAGPGPSPGAPGGFEQVLRNNLANYDQARAWRAGNQAMLSASPWVPPVPAYKVSVDADGIYVMDYDFLKSASLPVDDLDPRTFRLLDRGNEVAIEVKGEANGVFEDGEYVLFYGQKETTKYTDEHVYWLTYGGGISEQRITQRSGAPSGTAPVPDSFKNTIRREVNTAYSSTIPGDDEFERWYWLSWLAYKVPAYRDHDLTLSSLASDTYSATLRMPLLGGFDEPLSPDHHAQVFLNGEPMWDGWWDGVTWVTVEEQFDQSLLVEGTNTVRVLLPNDTGVTYLGDPYDRVRTDWIELDIHDQFVAEGNCLRFWFDQPGVWEFRVSGYTTGVLHVFDITDPAAVGRIVDGEVTVGNSLHFEDTVVNGTEYIALAESAFRIPTIELDVPSDLGSTSHGADYILITHADFLQSAQDLADYRQGWGLRTAVIDVQEIYDAFSFGIFDPRAIKDFLAYAYGQWQPPAPSYVVLLGDGNFDFKNYYGLGGVNYVPPLMKMVDPWKGEVAADNQFVCVDGPGDRIPDMHLGRIAVNTVAQAQAVVDKVIAYEGVPQDAGWNKHLLFTADNTPDPAGDFPAHSEDLINYHLPEPPYIADRVYLDSYSGCVPGAASCPAATADLIAKVNDGRLFVNYIGHGGQAIWAAERLLLNSDVAKMSNQGKYPITVVMTCSEGEYAHPMTACLAETLTRTADKGAVATWSMTGFGTVSGHDWLNSGFFDAMFKDDVRRLGPATLGGKLNLWKYGSEDHLLDISLIFGDPALRINALNPELQIEKNVDPPGQVEPGDVLTYTVTFTNASAEATAHHVVLTDIMHPLLLSPTVVSVSPVVVSQRPGVTYAWDIADLGPGDGGQIQIHAQVDPNTGPAAILNEAVIYSPASQDVFSVTTGVQVPDLYVTKTGPEAVTFSQTITYTIAWGNDGRATAPHTRLTDTWPPWVAYVGDSSGWPHTEPSPGVMVWELGPDPVPTGTHEAFVLTGWVTMDPDMVGPLINRVEISSDLPDGNPKDSRDTVVTDLLLHDLSIKAGGPLTVSGWSEISFTVAYSNVGDVAALNAVITDILPPGAGYVRDDSGFIHDEPVPGTHTWQVTPDPLPPGGGGAFTVVAWLGTYPYTGPVVVNTVQIGADSPDPEADNDRDQWATSIRRWYHSFFPANRHW